MKKFLSFLATLAFCTFAVSAQNDKADNIIGKYICGAGKDAYKVEISKQADGNYGCRIFWVADPLDENGKPALDTKNPDKSLRTVPMDKVVLFKDLKYNADKKHWSDTKIYDPNRGIRVKVTISFDNPQTLKVRGTVFGIGETVTWKRL